MGVINNGTYDNNGVLTDAKTGQAVAPNDALHPTPEQLAARTGAANLADVNAPVLSPIQRTIDQPGSGADAAQSYLDTFKAPESREQIAERLRKESQGRIDNINSAYDAQIAQARTSGEDRIVKDNAISVLSGLTGSTDALNARNTVVAGNDKEQQAINAKRLLDVQSVYDKISADALTEADKQKTDATASAKDIVERRKKVQTEALDNIKLMASAGIVDFDGFKNSPQEHGVYQHALDAVGGSEEALRAVFAINRPQDTLVGTPVRAGDHYVQAYKNPITGKVSYDTLQIPGGIPAEYKSFQKLGDNIVAIPDNWDGDTSKLKTIAGTPSTPDPVQLSEGEVLIDPVTGKVIYKNAKTYAPPKKKSSGNSGGTDQFTETQLNKGAQGAGLGRDAFDNLDGDVQNFYVNGGKAKTALDTSISDVKSGAQSADAVKALIDSSNQPDAVKAHLKERVDKAAPAHKASFWEKVGGLFH